MITVVSLEKKNTVFKNCYFLNSLNFLILNPLVYSNVLIFENNALKKNKNNGSSLIHPLLWLLSGVGLFSFVKESKWWLFIALVYFDILVCLFSSSEENASTFFCFPDYGNFSIKGTNLLVTSLCFMGVYTVFL